MLRDVRRASFICIRIKIVDQTGLKWLYDLITLKECTLSSK